MGSILVNNLKNPRFKNAGTAVRGFLRSKATWSRCLPPKSENNMSDDISALISGLGQFKVIRRRLSTVDEDASRRFLRKLATNVDQQKSGLSGSLKSVIAFKNKGMRISPVAVEKAVLELCTTYNETDVSEKRQVLSALAENNGVHVGEVNQTVSSLLCCREDSLQLKLLEELRYAMLPEYQWFFLQVAKLENGVKFLVDMRSDIIDYMKETKSERLRIMNEHLKDLISLWFSVGFLKLERITWDSPKEVLEKVTEYEAVHPMKSVSDLRQRVGPYRRCFAFTHPCMPGEPIVVLHTALMQGITAKIADIVNEKYPDAKEDSSKCDSAIFYSITSTQKGLLGIELGNFLIKRAAKFVKKEFSGLTQFSSLSPIPGFRRWLLGALGTDASLLSEADIKYLAETFNVEEDAESVSQQLRHCLETGQFLEKADLKESLESVLTRLCATYLVKTKRGGYAYDPVAHFHLKNGAVVWRVNWLGDLSKKGINQSFGFMVNYRYYLEDCDTNTQEYVENQKISTSDLVRALL